MNATIFKSVAAGIAISALSTVALGAEVVAELEDQTNNGGFYAEVKIVDAAADNTVTITADISDPINVGLTQGDILALWFDFADFSALGGTASISNTSPTIVGTTYLSENSVSSDLGGNVNLNTALIKDTWDFGIEIGTNGAPLGFIETVSFDLTITGLDSSQFINQLIGMRVQSIEGLDNFSEGSAKLTGDGETGSETGGTTGDVPVPVPGTLALLGLGLLGLSRNRRKAL